MKYYSDDIIDGTSLNLNEFLQMLFTKPDKIYPNNCFPTNELLDEYINTISDRSDDEVKNVINHFIVHEGSYGSDQLHLELMKKNKEYLQNIKSHHRQYLKRFLLKKPVWEGITWILDLLPSFPHEAINVIDGFFLAYCMILPDNVVFGLSNVNELIRAKFYDKEQPIKVLYDLSPLEFESVIAELFEHMGYSVELTKRSYDGGIDVIIEKDIASKKERTFIQCKKYKNTIGVKDVRELLGVVEDKKATKGILCTCSDFSRSAIKLSNNNSRIELLSGKQITRLCNEYFGSNWPIKIGNYLYKNRIIDE